MLAWRWTSHGLAVLLPVRACRFTCPSSALRAPSPRVAGRRARAAPSPRLRGEGGRLCATGARPTERLRAMREGRGQSEGSRCGATQGEGQDCETRQSKSRQNARHIFVAPPHIAAQRQHGQYDAISRSNRFATQCAGPLLRCGVHARRSVCRMRAPLGRGGSGDPGRSSTRHRLPHTYVQNGRKTGMSVAIGAMPLARACAPSGRRHLSFPFPRSHACSPLVPCPSLATLPRFYTTPARSPSAHGLRSDEFLPLRHPRGGIVRGRGR